MILDGGQVPVQTAPAVAGEKTSTFAGSELSKVKLEVFEGPLDLLLYLIRKNEVDIYDIPISLITEQFLAAINLMEELNFNLAGDFILMASELAHIKSRLVLPQPKFDGDEVFETDPRAELVKKLLEYQRYKDAAYELSTRPMLGRDVFLRPNQEPSGVNSDDLAADLVEIEPFKLLEVFAAVLAKVRPEISHHVAVEKISISEKIYELLELLKTEKQVNFASWLVQNQTRSNLVVSFLAILEMARLRLVHLFQRQTDQAILIERHFADVDASQEKIDSALKELE